MPIRFLPPGIVGAFRKEKTIDSHAEKVPPDASLPHWEPTGVWRLSTQEARKTSRCQAMGWRFRQDGPGEYQDRRPQLPARLWPLGDE